VKSVDIWKTFDSESINRFRSDAQVLKYGDQIGLETLVVHTLNNECSTSFGIRAIGGLKLTRETLRLGNVAARSKLKGIDGDLYKGWSMWFNSTYREKPYQFLYRVFVVKLA
jgi:hypothetical protein